MQRNGVLFVVLFFLVSRWGTAGTLFMPRSFMPGSFMPTSGSGVFAGDGERAGGAFRSGLTLSSLLPEDPEFEPLLPEDFGVKQVSMPEDNGQVPVVSGEPCPMPWTGTHLHTFDEFKRDIPLTCWPVELHRDQTGDSFPAIEFRPDTEPYEESTTDALQYAGLLTGEGQIYHGSKPLSYDSGVIALRSDVLVYRQQGGQYWLVVYHSGEYFLVSLAELLGSDRSDYFERMWKKHFGDHPLTFVSYGRQSTRANHNGGKTVTGKKPGYPLRNHEKPGQARVKYSPSKEGRVHRKWRTPKKSAASTGNKRGVKLKSGLIVHELIRYLPYPRRDKPTMVLFPNVDEKREMRVLPDTKKALLKKWEKILSDAGFVKARFDAYWKELCKYARTLQDAAEACVDEKEHCSTKLESLIKTGDAQLQQWLTDLAKDETEVTTKDSVGVQLFVFWLDELTLWSSKKQHLGAINWRKLVAPEQQELQHQHTDIDGVEEGGSEGVEATLIASDDAVSSVSVVLDNSPVMPFELEESLGEEPQPNSIQTAIDIEAMENEALDRDSRERESVVVQAENPESDVMEWEDWQPEAEADVLPEQQGQNNLPEDEIIDEAVVAEAKESKRESEIEDGYIEQTSASRAAEILKLLFGEGHSNEASAGSEDDSDTFNWGSLSM